MAVAVEPVAGLPEISEGDSIGLLVAERAELTDADVVVISQKVVSKAEGMLRRLEDVEPDERALELAGRLDKDPALVALVLAESNEVLRAERGILITRTRHGFVCANSGIDSSNVAGDGVVALLPADPDASARRIRREIEESSDRRPAVVIADSFGRAWRVGQAEVAIGCAGLAPLDDWRGRADRDGRTMAATEIAIADEAAAAADLVRDKSSGTPVAVVRGIGHHVTREDGPGAAVINRARDEDLFGA